MERTTRKFDSLQAAILRQVSKFVEDFSMYPDWTKVGLDICISEGRKRLNSVLTDDCFGGILEAADTKELYMISPFIWSLLDLVYAESHSTPITTIFTEYLDISYSVYVLNGRQQCIPLGIYRLRRYIQQFKTTAVAFSVPIGCRKWEPSNGICYNMFLTT